MEYQIIIKTNHKVKKQKEKAPPYPPPQKKNAVGGGGGGGIRDKGKEQNDLVHVDIRMGGGGGVKHLTFRLSVKHILASLV